jgi:competence protein ComEC
MLVAPVVAPITIIGFTSVLLLPIPTFTDFLLLVTKSFAEWIVLISGLTNHVPSWGISPALLVALMITTWVTFRCRSLLFAISLVLIFVIINFVPRLAFPGPAWRILQCDVGQGDALLVNLGGGSAILFDTGPDPNLLRRCLSSADVSNLPLVVLSHGHADHYFGFNELSSRVDVGTIWSNGSGVIDQITSNRAIPVEQGFQARIGDAQIDVLWPAPHSSNFSTLSGDGSAENNRSLVLLVTLDGVKLLITGDIEPEVQGLLAKRYDLSDINIMKVPHHGSRYQDSSFIEEVRPEVSLVSVGAGNTYGHPSAEVLAALYEMGSRALRTDRDGPVALAWRFDDSAQRYIFTMKSMRKEWWRIQWR